jgi:hypothetical protein
MDLRALARQGYNFSQIGALVGLDRRTVKKPLQLAQPPVYRRSLQSSKRDPFRPLLEQWLVRAPGLRATRIYRDVHTHYGFSGSYPIGQRLVRMLRPPRPVAAHVRFETAAGHQAPVAWRHEDVSYGQHPGPLYAWHLTRGYSRDAYVAYTDRQDLTTFWACHLPGRADGYPSGPPTDPYVRHARRRFLKQSLCYPPQSTGVLVSGVVSSASRPGFPPVGHSARRRLPSRGSLGPRFPTFPGTRRRDDGHRVPRGLLRLALASRDLACSRGAWSP